MSKEEQFEKFNEEYRNFERIENPLFRTPKLCGLAAIEKLEGKEIEFSAEHDVLCCGSCERELTDEEVIYLVRCGIGWDSEFDCFYFFT